MDRAFIDKRHWKVGRLLKNKEVGFYQDLTSEAMLFTLGNAKKGTSGKQAMSTL